MKAIAHYILLPIPCVRRKSNNKIAKTLFDLERARERKLSKLLGKDNGKVNKRKVS